MNPETLALLIVLVVCLLAVAHSALRRGQRPKALGALGGITGAVAAVLVVHTSDTCYYYDRHVTKAVMVVTVWSRPVYNMERPGVDSANCSRMAYLLQWGSMVFGAFALGAICWKIVQLDRKAQLALVRSSLPRD